MIGTTTRMASYEIPLYGDNEPNLVPMDLRSKFVLSMTLDSRGRIADYALSDPPRSFSAGLQSHLGSITMPDIPSVFAMEQPISGDIQIRLISLGFRQSVPPHRSGCSSTLRLAPQIWPAFSRGSLSSEADCRSRLRRGSAASNGESAGRGALTRHLLERTPELHAIEIDKDRCVELEREFAGRSGFHLHEGDVLNTDLTQWGPAVITGNVPYYITSPIVGLFLRLDLNFPRAVFLIQEEVAERLRADQTRETMDI